MKRIFVLLVLMLLTVGLVSCTNGDSLAGSEADNQLLQSSDTEATLYAAESMESEGIPTEFEPEPTEFEPELTESVIEPTEFEPEPMESVIEPTESESESMESVIEPTESEIEPTESEVEPTESEIEPTESEVEPTKSEPEPTESEPEPSLGELGGESLIYEFHTIKDLHTYATTGSTNLEDYSARPSPSLDIMPPLDVINFFGYHSIYEYFTFDEAAFDTVYALFRYEDHFEDHFTGLKYRYVLDELVTVEIRSVPSLTLLDCYRRRTGKNITENDLVPYSKDGFGSERRELTVLREFGDFKIVYDVLSGVKTRAHFIVGDCYITIEGVRGSLYGPLEELYDVFVSNEKVSAFSAFFSDDDETIAAAVERAQKPVEDEAEEAK